MTDTAPRCPDCQHKPRPCPPCQGQHNLDTLPTLLQQLPVALVVGHPGLVEFVSGNTFTSRLPAHVDTLSSLATTPGQIHHTLTHPDQTPPRDLPPAVWITAWATVWRGRHHHHSGPGTRRQAWNHLPPLLDHEPTRAARAHYLSTRRDFGARVVLGLAPAALYEGKPLREHDPDPLAEAWTARHGTPRLPRRLVTDVNYLRAWLTHALAEWDDTPVMLRDLHHHTTTLRRLLGEQTQRMLLGRCPEVVTDTDGREVSVERVTEDGRTVWEVVRCGQRLYREPDQPPPIVVTCRRCGTVTPEKRLLWLAVRMREAWGETEGRDAWQG